MSTNPGHAALTLDDTVTGEAVAIDLPAAGIGVRLVSGLIDVVVVGLVLVVCDFLFLLASVNLSEALVHVAVVSVSIVSLLVVPTTIETLTRGRSAGKWMMGLRVVREDAGPVTAQHAFVRALVGVVEIYLFGGAPALLAVLCNSRGKRLGDFAAGTYVVRDRSRLVLPTPPTMPPELATWARSADLAPLPTAVTLGVRQFLARGASLTPQARMATGTALVAQVQAYVAPPPPPGTHPEAYLVAVMAERRERDLARLRREQAVRDRLNAAAIGG
ncbi:RDD family protein [Nocardioides daphniae]|uniref:RDD family protein n=1 Tax=Nocardioides daphniae TaxID=402297 RepID=A0A4P7UCR0_9ACTN|nr:RDD family protein [Nocardioides daphniae]QCC78022.1 RDD family protein [Nocardioides daphniae]GGD22977.1 hypothetical protein GCM10007231_22580 [Nocardioides daphniae]